MPEATDLSDECIAHSFRTDVHPVLCKFVQYSVPSLQQIFDSAGREAGATTSLLPLYGERGFVHVGSHFLQAEWLISPDHHYRESRQDASPEGIGAQMPGCCFIQVCKASAGIAVGQPSTAVGLSNRNQSRQLNLNEFVPLVFLNVLQGDEDRRAGQNIAQHKAGSRVSGIGRL